MGISTRFYTIFGVKTEYNKAFSEAYDEVYGQEGLPFFLMDSMCGEYMIFGVKLFESEDLRWSRGDGDVFVEIDLTNLENPAVEYRGNFAEKFPEFAHIVQPEFKLMTLVHYS